MIPIQRPSIAKEELKEVYKVFKTGWLGMGEKVKEFEDELKKFFPAKNVICVNTGTSALQLALESIELKPTDEVIVPSLTFVATIQAIILAGGIPVFCEVSPDTFLIDINDVLKKITKKTKAILPVHYAGLSCDMDKLLEIGKTYNLRIVEDAAHAFGSVYNGKKIGSFGDITCFSFDPVKNITCGEGGAVVSNNSNVAEKIIKKRILGIDKDTWSRYHHKRTWFYDVVDIGHRFHMSNINAAIGLVQLKKFPKFDKKKKQIVKIYDDELKNVSGIELLYRDYKNTSPFMYIVKAKQRDKLMLYLKQHGIDSGVHYLPNHLHKIFKKYFTPLPVTEKICKEIITLPLYYDMKDSEVEFVISKIKSFYQS